jgi:polyvinyl alcohol dehydrogenase (cytochrome)
MHTVKIESRPLIGFVLPLVLSLVAHAAENPSGAQLYAKHCAICHNSGAVRVPPAAVLRQIPVSVIVKALQFGVMRAQASAMSSVEQIAVARWLGSKSAVSISVDKLPNRCATTPALSTAAAWSSWGVTLDNTRFQTADAAGLTASDVPHLKLKWAFGFEVGTLMRSQPAVYGGRVFAAGPDGTVVSLDAATGCTYWSTAAVAQVRSGIVVALRDDRPTVFFGDASGQVYAIDALSGKPLWQIRADDHPAAMVTGTPAYFGGRLYVPVSSYEEASGVDPHYVCCTFRGSLLALEGVTGRVVWKTYTIAEVSKPGKPTRRGVSTSGPSGAGIWSSPTLDPGRGIVYVTTGDNYSDPPTETSDAVLALALDTGRILWSRQITHSDAFNVSCSRPDQATCPDSAGPDFDFGSSPILVRPTDGQRALILPQKSGMLYAVDPDRLGKELWHSRVGNGSWLGGIQWGAASNDSKIYVALSDVGLIPTEQLGSKNVDIWGKPVPPGLTLDPQHGGGMFAFRADNGERLWYTSPSACGERRPCSPAQSQAVSGIPGIVFSGSMDGHLRAFSTADGTPIWDYDTARGFGTVNAVKGKGGALDGGGAVIAGGMVLVGSGYSQWGGLPGNVLLAFSVDGR